MYEKNNRRKVGRGLLNSLIMHLSGLNVGGYGTSKIAQFCCICCSGDISALDMIVQRWIRCSERRREAVIHHWVDKLSALSKHDFSYMVKRETCLFHSICHSHSLEITAVVDFASIPINERIVGCWTMS